MNNSTAFKIAHKIAKLTIRDGDDYRITFGAALKLVKAGKTGSEKQVSWADDIQSRNAVKFLDTLLSYGPVKTAPGYDVFVKSMTSVVTESRAWVWINEMRSTDCMMHNLKSLMAA